ncbi:MAG: hypothetical protein L0G13_07160, partial [Lactococcus lactis]|nr:hypothetical protein [Lactococcus lactis]
LTKNLHRIAFGASALTEMLVFSSVIFKINQILSGLVTLLFYLFFGKNALFPLHDSKINLLINFK